MDKNKKEKIEELEELFSYLGKLIGSLVEEEPTGFKAEEIGTVVTETVEKKDEAAEPQVTFEQVRMFLGELSSEGFDAKVRELLENYGAKKLSQVKPECYKELMAKAEALTNA